MREIIFSVLDIVLILPMSASRHAVVDTENWYLEMAVSEPVSFLLLNTVLPIKILSFFTVQNRF
jgi:hypothetical protein